MSKKSYKRHQNRLYREIHRRILAENMLIKPMKFSVCERKIETIKIKSIIPNYMAEHIEVIKTDAARQIANKLISDGYVEFLSREPYKDTLIMDITEIEARLDVVRPMELT